MSDRLEKRSLNRSVRFSRIRPQPPRQVAVTTTMVTWKPPADLTNITHFRIYANGNADTNLAREVSVGQNEVDLVAQSAWVSSYSLTGQSESVRVRASAAEDLSQNSDTNQGIIAYYA